MPLVAHRNARHSYSSNPYGRIRQSGRCRVIANQAYRLPEVGAIDRSRSLTFMFDGRAYGGFAGDTLTSALIANGVRLIGRSFKYHRPRGIFTSGPEEPNALVELGAGARREPNTKATTIELFDGLVAASQNRWPSLRIDLGAINSLLAPFIGAGFYYKTLMWPASFWETIYEPLIRRSAGLGRAAEGPDPDNYEKAHAFCDLLVIGSGPAGLMSALIGARAGARVILCEEDFAIGGRLLAEKHEIDGQEGRVWAAQTEARLTELQNVRIFRRTSVFGVYDGGTYGALERVTDHLRESTPHQARQRLWKIVARHVVLATGAVERHIVFGGNDKPGVMLASAARTYVNRFAALPGRHIAIFTCCDDGWKTAADFATAGATVVAVIDVRREISRAFARVAERIGARLVTGGRVVGTRGGRSLRSIDVIGADGQAVRFEVDCLGVSGGWNPTIDLTCHHGSKPRWSDDQHAYIADKLPPGLSIAGAAAGALSLPAALLSGAKVGHEAIHTLGFIARFPDLPRTDEDPARLNPFWHVRGSRGKAFVDLQNDVTVTDIEIAFREGFRSVEHLKRYTTLGMGTDQGKAGNVSGYAIMADLTGSSITVTGTTIYRPPHVPIAISAFAGHHRGKNFRPTRLTPSHRWAAEHGAIFVETGPWLRAQYFPKFGETDWLTTISREVTAVRTAVGVCDVSTLGKIEIQGTDAGTFLDRIYINTFSTLLPGKTRYGVMLREDGLVMDDGTTARLAADRYVMSTTTANAGLIMQHLEFCHQVLWPTLDVQLASISETWAQFSVAGPCSRATLAKLVDPPFNIANERFPHLSVASLTVCGGVPARLFRLSFSGELAYELAVPANYGDGVIRVIMSAGAEFGIEPYGTEALGVMRIEKGHVAGNEITGQMTARDLGLGRLMSTKKDFIGRRMAERIAFHDPNRPCVVGFRPTNRSARLQAGAHFVPCGAAPTAANDEGFMSSVAFSPSLGHWIGRGFLQRGPERIGGRVRAYDPVRATDVEVEICNPVFIDPEGGRLRA
ncbi:MAG: sarcosine oxidase subunit alpha family protein [Alphaproteobacteria bacterium]|nr:sarcosine oxidase subunit alpha family protein [Alphaproteobacteria bacterium]